MTEIIYLTQEIKNILTNMAFGPREKIALYLGDRVSQNEIYVTNTTGHFEGQIDSVSLERLFQWSYVIGAITNANRSFRERGLPDRFILFLSHSHPRNLGEIVQGYDTAWSVDDVTSQYEKFRGQIIVTKDKNNNEIKLGIKSISDGKGGDDIALKQIADEWRAIEYEFFVRPPNYLVGRPMAKEVAVDCYKYDPEMRLGKIRKIEISEHILTPQDLIKTILDPKKLKIVETDPNTGNFVLPYRRRR